MPLRELRPRLPLSLKLAYTAWLIFWAAVYWHDPGPQNFFWLCDVANFLICVALWRESALLASAQAVGVLLVQTVWTADFTVALLTGRHPVGGTEYMFDATKPLWMRSLSLFHVVVPVLLLWLIRRLGYDRRGWKLQSLLTWLLLPATYFLTDPEENLNWVRDPFGIEQVWMPPLAYLGLLLIAYPLLIYLPTHLALRAWRGADKAE